MVDPLTLGAAGAAAVALWKLTDAGAEWLTLRGRAELVRAAAELPPGAQVSATRRDGTGWLAQVPAPGERRR